MGHEWREVRLGDLIAIKHGWPFKSELYSQDLTGRPVVVSVGNFRYTGGFRFEETAIKEYRGDYPVDGVCSTDIVVISAHEERWFGFVLCQVSSDEFIEYTNAGSTGTKMPRTSWTEMARYGLLLPPAALAEAFNDLVRPSANQTVVGIHESRTLAQLRDTLLPKLISGEFRIPDAERFLERAT